MKALQIGALSPDGHVMGMSYARNDTEVLIIVRLYLNVGYDPIILDINLPDSFTDFDLPLNPNFSQPSFN